MKPLKYFLTLLFLHCFLLLQAKYISIPDSIDLGVSIKLRWFFSPRGSGGSNYSVSASFSASKNLMEKKDWSWSAIPFWQISANIYSNGLGTNLLPSEKRAQIDFVNSVGLSNGFGKLPAVPDTYVIQPFNFMTSSAMMHDVYGFNFAFGSNFIVNNHRRNQQIGFLNLGFHRYLQISFHNDGPPFHVVGLGDGFDRWWTGGLGVEFKWPNKDVTSNNYNSFYYQYDRFTGDVQDAYILSNYMYFNKVPTKDKIQNFFNRGQTILGLKHYKGAGISVAFLGDYPFDIQDNIHDLMHKAHHFSLAQKNSWHLGIDFSRFFLQQTVKFPE